MNIVQYPTKNKSSRNGKVPCLIVDHIAEGYFNGTISWFRNWASQASAHFVIGKDGAVAQLVPLTEKAWTNGDVRNPTSDIVKSLGGNPNEYSYTIEHVGFYREAQGGLTPAQLQSSIEVHRYIDSEHTRLYGSDFIIDRRHVIGHYEINSIGKPNCPGQAFPFNQIISALNPVIAPAPVANINVGNIVRITGTKYATGQNIPLWVRMGTHIVSQFNKDRTQALLGAKGGICSWVKVSDIKLA